MIHILALFDWMPFALACLACGVVCIFFLVGVLRIIRFILDLIPFV